MAADSKLFQGVRSVLQGAQPLQARLDLALFHRWLDQRFLKLRRDLVIEVVLFGKVGARLHFSNHILVLQPLVHSVHLCQQFGLRGRLRQDPLLELVSHSFRLHQIDDVLVEGLILVRLNFELSDRDLFLASL